MNVKETTSLRNTMHTTHLKSPMRNIWILDLSIPNSSFYTNYHDYDTRRNININHTISLKWMDDVSVL